MLVLRPEQTPSLARMIAQRQQALVKPIRWWTFGPCWRYEQPQQGRTREFYMWNVALPLAASASAWATRYFELLLQRDGRMPAVRAGTTTVLLATLAPELLPTSLQLAQALRAAGLDTDVYPEAEKLSTQLKYANRQGIPFAVLLGPDEAAAGQVTVRDLRTGEQVMVAWEELAGYLTTKDTKTLNK